jgi:hypothetical protein
MESITETETSDRENRRGYNLENRSLEDEIDMALSIKITDGKKMHLRSSSAMARRSQSLLPAKSPIGPREIPL